MAKRAKIKEINEETIIVMYGLQTFCLHDFGDRNAKWHVKSFAEELGTRQTVNLSTLLEIAKRHNIKLKSARDVR